MSRKGPDPRVRRPNPSRILVRSANWLGDAVMTTPALLRLREAFPEASIALLSPEKLEDLWRRHPAVDSIVSVSRPEGVLKVGRSLRAAGFDLGIAFPNSFRSALELWLGGVPRRIGYRTNGRSPMLTEAIARPANQIRMRKRSEREIRRLIRSSAAPVDPDRPVWPPPEHQLHHYLHLAAAAGARSDPLPPKIVVGEDERSAVRSRFGLRAEVAWLGVSPGAEYGPAKRWPEDRFARVLAEYGGRAGWGAVMVGGGNDRELARRVEEAARGRAPRQLRLLNLAGQTTLRELCAILSLCRVVLTNDSGPMHVAAAVKTPVVAAFGSTSMRLTGPGLPGQGPHRLLGAPVVCSPCFRRACPIDFRCMNGIGVAQVLEAIDRAAKVG